MRNEFTAIVEQDGPWHDQIQRDSLAGKLDFLFDEAERQSAQGTLREWPPE